MKKIQSLAVILACTFGLFPVLKGQNNLSISRPIRYLVVYTNGMAAALGGDEAATDAIYIASNELHQALNNSCILQEIDLVRTLQINFSETGNSYTDFKQILATNNFDALRADYRADLVLVVMNNDDICGTPLVENAVADRGTAFCAVNWKCMAYAYGLPHMIAHLFGAGHTPVFDSNVEDDAAFTYGHAFTWSFQGSDCGFSTIMALPDAQNCCWGYTARGPLILHFSNPDVKFSGVSTGIDSICDNASVIRNSAQFLDFFDLTALSSISDTVQFADLALLQGIDSLKNSSHYLVKDSAQVWFRAATRITLEPGFTAEEGTYFETILDTNMVHMR